MFTGIVEKVATVLWIRNEGKALSFAVELSFPDELLALGESMAVNGVCLTVERVQGEEVSFTAVEESLERTTLKSLAPGHAVNVERALKVGHRMGGHFVTGHVDGTGRICRVKKDKGAYFLYLETLRTLTDLMIPKGSVAVDGVSLTLVEVKDGLFSVTLVPYTLKATTLGSKKAGDAVNVEVDLLAKLVQRMLREQGRNLEWKDLEETGFV